MKSKLGIFLVVALLLMGVTSVGFAAIPEEGPAADFKDACMGFFENLSPEDQDALEEAREEFAGQREEIRQNFLAELPADERAALDAKIAERGEKGGMYGKRNGGVCGKDVAGEAVQ